ncbi:MAG: hypothetical protein HQ592_02425 [Planctomycetes bacterium]|nr:hypothetical protein [Planctomycetota bacterium]
MTVLEGKVNRVKQRLALIEFLVSAARLLFYLAIVAAALVVIDRFFHLGHTVALIAGACAVAGGVAWFVLTRKRINAGYAARQIDGTFGLQERISTALAITRSSVEPMAPALAADAERHAQNIDAARFRFQPPREFKLLPAPMLALAVGLLFVPQMDILGRQQRDTDRRIEREEVKKRAEHMAIKVQHFQDRIKKEKLTKLNKLALKMQKLADDLAKAPKTKQQAMVKMSKLTNEIRKQREKTDRADKFNALKLDKTGKLRDKTERLSKAKACMKKLTDALQKGKLDEAAAALAKLADQLKSGEISPEEAKKLGEALKELARNMPANDQLTQNLADLAEQLGSLDPKDAAKLAKAMQQMKLTQQQMQELQKLMQQASSLNFAQDLLEYEKACMSCNNPSNICKACGNKSCIGCGTFGCVCCPFAFGPDGGPCCQGCCAGGLGAGMGTGPAAVKGPRGGMGQGQRPLAEKGPVDFNPTKLPPNIGPGKILATQFLRGMPPDDAEAKAEYRDVLGEARKMADDAVRREDIPPQYREKIKQYFDDLEEQK